MAGRLVISQMLLYFLIFWVVAERDIEVEDLEDANDFVAGEDVDNAAEEEPPSVEAHRRSRRSRHTEADNADIRDQISHEEHRQKRRHRHRRNRSELPAEIVDTPTDNENLRVDHDSDLEIPNYVLEETNEESHNIETESLETDYEEPLEASEGEPAGSTLTNLEETTQQIVTPKNDVTEMPSDNIPLATPMPTKTPKPETPAPTTSSAETVQEPTQAPVSKKKQIEEYWPQKAPVQGGIPIFVNTIPVLRPPVFCRFNYTHVVHGKVLENGTIMCTAPPIASGLIALEVSKDKHDWIGTATIKFVDFDIWGGDMFNLFIIALVVGVPVFLAVKFANTVFCRRSKRKKSDESNEVLDMKENETEEKEDEKPSRKRRSII